MWNETVNFQIVFSSLNINIVNCIVSATDFSIPWQFTFLYGPPISGLRLEFWDCLASIGDAFSGPWNLIGDFNSLLSQEDKIGGRAVSCSSIGGFQHFVNSYILIDLGFHGHPYTWNNKQIGSANIQERLDRCFGNLQWKTLFPNAMILHLAVISFDHKPLLFNANLYPQHPPKPFKFEAMWIDHPDTAHIIQTTWTKGSSLSSKLKHTKDALKLWNRQVFGHLPSKIQHIQKRLLDIQQQPHTHQSLLAEQAAPFELDELEKREALFWKERAKARWTEEGDQNTHYFHVTTLFWIHDRPTIGDTFETFFTSIFASVHPVCPNHLQEFILPVITDTMNDSLMSCPTNSEITKALFSMGNYKSPQYRWHDRDVLQAILGDCPRDCRSRNPRCVHLRPHQTIFQPHLSCPHSESQRGCPG